MNCLYYSLNKFDEEYADYQNNVIKNKRDFLKIFKKSYDLVKKYNPNLDIKIFSTQPVEGFNVELFEFKDNTSHGLDHRHFHYEKLKEYDTVMYMNYNVYVKTNLDEYFGRYNDGLYMRYHEWRFYDGIIFTNRESREKIIKTGVIDNEKDIKEIAIPDVGLGAEDCFYDIQPVKDYFYPQIYPRY